MASSSLHIFCQNYGLEWASGGSLPDGEILVLSSFYGNGHSGYSLSYVFPLLMFKRKVLVNLIVVAEFFGSILFWSSTVQGLLDKPQLGLIFNYLARRSNPYKVKRQVK
ncbi:hypothetical protein FRY98_13685 [Paenibacillus faecis]|uniref:Uncharacterized protein n=1 Tax=Paenibacillus faecis TaxID=862114 RepID=A0A5D0CPU0_9BACL|nr:hypothetical protein [Paenibacillus faecis]TYA11802.1 hypothetical protein FRY98_13685 [Paenibacillus faecis]